LKQLLKIFALMALLWAGTAVLAQEQCSAIIEQAIALVSETCYAAGRNEACHGYYRVEAKDRTGYDSLQFNVGDIVSVLEVSALTTAPMNLDDGEWGVALLRLQANLPDILPGQNVTFLLLGDTRIQADDTSENARPLQIFQLQTGITGIRCSEGPADGMLVQTPHDVQRVKLMVNGVTIEAAGTAFVQAQPGKAMTVSALDGIITVSMGDQRQTLETGTQVEIPMSDTLTPSGEMSAPVAVPLSSFVGLPVELLPRPVDSPLLSASQGVESALASSGGAADVLASTAVPLVSIPSSQLTGAIVDPQSTLLTISVVVLVSLLALLLIVILVRGVVRQIRLKRGAD
jgi:hypothetical protein